jgi:hypothetical protein
MQKIRKTNLKTAQRTDKKRGKAAKWTLDTEFDSLAEFDDSPVLQDLLDNFNMDNKMTTKNGDIVRSFVCKFSKKKKGFNCPVKSRTVLSSSDNKMRVYRLEESEHDHSAAETSERKNFTFGKNLLVLNVSTTNIRKHLLDNNFYTTDTFPPDQVFHSKISNIRKKLNIDRKTICLREFEAIIAQFSEEPEDPTEPFIVTYLGEEDNTGRLRYSVMFSRHLLQTYMKPEKNWLLSFSLHHQCYHCPQQGPSHHSLPQRTLRCH